MMVYHLFVGIDIAARSFTASWTRDRRSFTPAQTFPQHPDGFARMERQLTATGVAPAETLLVLEATSSYWVVLAVHLHEAGYQVAVVNPMHLRNYARSLPRRAKTDALDAQLLAQFAAERQPDTWTPPPQVYHELRQRLVTRDTLVTMRQQTRNQHHALSQWPVTIASALQHLEEVIADLDARIATLDRELAALLRESAWAASAMHLVTRHETHMGSCISDVFHTHVRPLTCGIVSGTEPHYTASGGDNVRIIGLSAVGLAVSRPHSARL